MNTVLGFLCLIFAYMQQTSVEGKKDKAIIYTEKYADTDIERGFVPVDMHRWSTEFSSYAPMELSSAMPDGSPCDPVVLTPKQITFNKKDKEAGVDRRSLGGKYGINRQGQPLNPKGRSGMSGRGLLPRWGPNFYVVLVALRGKEPYEMLVQNATEYSVFDRLGLPGEFVDMPKGVVIPPKLRSMMKKNLADQDYNDENIEEILTSATKKARKIFSGFIPDERNTDNAWVEMIMYQIDDPTATELGLIDPKLTAEMSNMRWKELIIDDLIKELERVVQRSKMSTGKSIKHGFISWKERFRRMSGKQKAGTIFGMFTLAINILAVGLTTGSIAG